MTQGDAVEETVQMILDLPPGQDWKWLPDCNIVVLASRLDEEGRQRALTDLQATWRRQLIRVLAAEPEQDAPMGLSSNVGPRTGGWRMSSHLA